MITPSGFDTQFSGAIELIMLSGVSGTIVFIDGEYFLANEFYPAKDSQEYHTLTGVNITQKLEGFSSSQKSGDVNATPVTAEFILKSMPVKQQFHKDTHYRWFQNIYKAKF